MKFCSKPVMLPANQSLQTAALLRTSTLEGGAASANTAASHDTRRIRGRKRQSSRTWLAPLGCLTSFIALATGTAHANPKTPGYPEQVIQWTVGDNETCGDIALALYGSSRHVPLIERYSNVKCRGSIVLQAGLTLVVPAKVTALATAEVSSVKPEVRAKPPGGSWETASPGMPLHQRYSVNTREEARADIRFVDRTRIFLSERTLVVIYGTARQSQVAQQREMLVELDSGELQAGLEAIAGKKVEVGVSGGGHVSAASRDTVVRKQAEKKRTTVSVFDGSAEVESAGKKVDVPKNHGSAFVDQTAPIDAIPLPPAPNWLEGTSPVIVLALENQPSSAQAGGLIQAKWSPIERATAYRLELATDPKFENLVVREEVAANITQFRAENMPPDRYYVRVRAIDDQDFLGIASERRAVSVIQMSSGEASPVLQGKVLKVHQYQELQLNSPKGIELSLDERPFGAPPKSIDLGLAKPTQIKFRGIGESVEHSYQLEYASVAPKVQTETLPDGRVRVIAQFPEIDTESVVKRMQPQVRVSTAWKKGTLVDSPSASAPLVLATSSEEGSSANGGARYIAELPASGSDFLELVFIDQEGNRLGAGHWAADPSAPPPKLLLPEPRIGAHLYPQALHPSNSGPLWSAHRRSAAALSGGVTLEGSAQLYAQAQGSTGRNKHLPEIGISARIPSGRIHGDEPIENAAWLGGSAELWQAFDGHGSFGLGAQFGIPTESGSVSQAELSASLGRDLGKAYWLANLGGRTTLRESSREGHLAQAFLLVGAGYHILSWASVYGALDGRVLLGDEDHVPNGVAPRGGVSAGLEVGDKLFGNIGARFSPWDTLDNQALFQLGAGYRGF